MRIELATEGLRSLGLGLGLWVTVGTLALALVRGPNLRHRVADCVLLAVWPLTLLLLLPLPRPLALSGSGAGAGLDWSRVAWPQAASAQLPSASLPLLAEGASSPAAGEVAVFGPVLPLEVPLSLGALLVGLFLLASLLLLGRLIRGARPVPGWVDQLLPARGRRPRVLHSARVRRPVCCGWRPGTVLLPSSLLGAERRSQLQAVLHHECAHLALGHGWSRLVAALVSPLLFWHPLYWVLLRVQRNQAELLADDVAGERLGRRSYAGELLALAQEQRAAHWPLSPSLGVLQPKGAFFGRMQQLLLRDEPLVRRMSSFQRTGLLGLTLLGLAGISAIYPFGVS